MANNPNELTIENSILVLIDHQPWVAFAEQAIDRGLMINNVAGLVPPPSFMSAPIQAGSGPTTTNRPAKTPATESA